MITEIVEKGVYFIFSPVKKCSHISICIAEGLKKLGIPIFSNIDCWLIDLKNQEYLFKNDRQLHPNNCAIVVADIYFIEMTNNHPLFDLFCELNEEVILVIIDPNDSDHVLTGRTERLTAVIRVHMHKFRKYPSQYIPWAFGISERIRIATENSKLFSERKRQVLAVFRSSLSQSVRVAMNFCFISHLQDKIDINQNPITEIGNNVSLNDFDYLYWSQFRTHHIPKWFDSLKNSMFCCAYGGNFYYADLDEKLLENSNLGQKPAIARWDSWRFWESLAAGCVSIHLDFDKYGFLLPIKPVNWKHYVGIDLANPQEAAQRIIDEPELMAQIGLEGQRWALENYGSVPVACRFLDIVLGEEFGTIENLIDAVEDIS
ncbi:hypothetical protein [Okeania sp. SIO2B9]|uniref:hypothetical protein n=1 Tax=Okeania sp. SIO2B9 TaxID=2607782 RepID=UPI00142CD4B2|nr:hypothetical protein [Okeania sp. SIO2B9]NES91753.1 hypothetical protein [Okeania sp. SIO2B9]